MEKNGKKSDTRMQVVDQHAPTDDSPMPKMVKITNSATKKKPKKK
jgi:hypothetical protein